LARRFLVTHFILSNRFFSRDIVLFVALKQFRLLPRLVSSLLFYHPGALISSAAPAYNPNNRAVVLSSKPTHRPLGYSPPYELSPNTCHVDKDWTATDGATDSPVVGGWLLTRNLSTLGCGPPAVFS